MGGIALINHEILTIDEKNNLTYIDYIENLGSFFKYNDKVGYRLVPKGSRFKDIYEYLTKNYDCGGNLGVIVVCEKCLMEHLDNLSRLEDKPQYVEFGNRYAVITCSTDSCYPRYRVRFIRKSEVAKVDRSSKLTYKDPELARNYHSDIVQIVRLVKGYRKPSESWIAKQVRERAGYKYSPKAGEILARNVLENGILV